MRLTGLLIPALAALLVSTPDASLAQNFERIETAQAFDTHVVGRVLRWQTGETVINADGTTSGKMQNVGTYHGKWHWQDGYYCRALVVNDTAGEEKCLMVERAGDQLRMSYGKGEGRALELSISDK